MRDRGVATSSRPARDLTVSGWGWISMMPSRHRTSSGVSGSIPASGGSRWDDQAARRVHGCNHGRDDTVSLAGPRHGGARDTSAPRHAGSMSRTKASIHSRQSNPQSTIRPAFAKASAYAEATADKTAGKQSAIRTAYVALPRIRSPLASTKVLPPLGLSAPRPLARIGRSTFRKSVTATPPEERIGRPAGRWPARCRPRAPCAGES